MLSPRELSIASLDAVKAKQRETWLGLFAEDALVEDPVGKSPIDPAGNGFRGIAAIAGFYDAVVSRSDLLEYRIREWYECGNEVASAATFSIGRDGIARHDVNLIIVHKSDGNGKLMSIRAFWTFPKSR